MVVVDNTRFQRYILNDDAPNDIAVMQYCNIFSCPGSCIPGHWVTGSVTATLEFQHKE